MAGASTTSGDRATPASGAVRAWAGLAACACLALLAVAASLDADPRGFDTHTQLGLPKCGWQERFGVPCATCGMTTAFSHAADGSLLQSIAAQPFGALLALGSAVTVWVAGYVALTGARLGRFVGPLGRGRAVVILAAAFGAAWLYKIAISAPAVP